MIIINVVLHIEDLIAVSVLMTHQHMMRRTGYIGRSVGQDGERIYPLDTTWTCKEDTIGVTFDLCRRSRTNGT